MSFNTNSPNVALLPLSGGALSGALNEAKGADIASATTTDIGAATGNYVVVTGTTTITGLGTVQAGTRRIVNFSGALILTHNATSLILPTGANITTAAGDTAIFISLGSGNWVCTNYQRKDGTALAAASGGIASDMTGLTSDFSTGATDWVDVTGLNVTLLANKKYIIFFSISGFYNGAGSSAQGQFQLITEANVGLYLANYRKRWSETGTQVETYVGAINGYTSGTASIAACLNAGGTVPIYWYIKGSAVVSIGGSNVVLKGQAVEWWGQTTQKVDLGSRIVIIEVT